nr:maleylpyruvate isomerase N-terminal domain-containing protein [Brachybacterium sacelli]
MLTTVAELPDETFARPSGCSGWSVRDLVCHLVIDAQDVLITLATPADAAPTHDALSYWTPSATPPDGKDPFDALTVRLAAAYEDPALLRAHLEDLGPAAERAARLAHPDLPVSTQDMTLTVRDYLGAYVLEWTLHHLDLIAAVPGAGPPPAESLARSREMLERILRVRLPEAWADADGLRIATGRLRPTPAQRTELDALGVRGQMLPLSLG